MWPRLNRHVMLILFLRMMKLRIRRLFISFIRSSFKYSRSSLFAISLRTYILSISFRTYFISITLGFCLKYSFKFWNYVSLTIFRMSTFLSLVVSMIYIFTFNLNTLSSTSSFSYCVKDEASKAFLTIAFG